MTKKALYVGSFDPITKGHISVIQKSFELFEHLVIGVARNPQKKYMFSPEERKIMIEDALPWKEQFPGQVQVHIMPDVFSANYAHQIKAEYLVRGIRSSTDFSLEELMANMNQKINMNVNTVLFVPPKELSDVSSSFVKSMIGFEGWEDYVKDMVSDNVLYELIYKHNFSIPMEKKFECFWKKLKPKTSSTPYHILVTKYSTSNRFYHNLVHINDCLSNLECVKDYVQSPDHLLALEIAFWFHDIIQDGETTNDVIKSADFMKNIIEEHTSINKDIIDLAYRYILVSDHFNQTPQNLVEKIFKDIDLLCLSKPWDQFEIINQQIRMEYDHLPDAFFVEGRSDFFKQILKSTVYSHPFFFNKYESKARKNITRYLKEND